MTIQIDNLQSDPCICTIFGEAGLGKTSLAATFPNPLFLQVERGLKSVPGAAAMPQPTTVNELFAQLKSVIDGGHDYKTLVVDSITQLDVMFTGHILESDANKPQSLNQACGGYGGGYEALAGLHRRVRRAAEILRSTLGMHVVFLAHADVDRIESPDQDPYSRYSLRLHKKSAAVYVNDVDLVGFLRLKTALLGDEGKRRARSSGVRELVCHAVASNISKNRMGIDEVLTFDKGVNPLESYL